MIIRQLKLCVGKVSGSARWYIEYDESGKRLLVGSNNLTCLRIMATYPDRWEKSESQEGGYFVTRYRNTLHPAFGEPEINR